MSQETLREARAIFRSEHGFPDLVVTVIVGGGRPTSSQAERMKLKEEKPPSAMVGKW